MLGEMLLLNFIIGYLLSWVNSFWWKKLFDIRFSTCWNWAVEISELFWKDLCEFVELRSCTKKDSHDLKDTFDWFVCLQQLQLESYLLFRKIKCEMEECGHICLHITTSFMPLFRRQCKAIFGKHCLYNFKVYSLPVNVLKVILSLKLIILPFVILCYWLCMTSGIVSCFSSQNQGKKKLSSADI